MARTPSTAATERGAATRQRLIAATAELIEAGGYRATGLLQVVARSGAPRGSLYFHFPGGKEELAAQAVAASAGALSQLIARELESDAPTAVAVAGLIDALADRLEGSGWSHGCPVATVALEVSADEPTLGAACRDAYVDWQALLAERLVRDGLDEALARLGYGVKELGTVHAPGPERSSAGEPGARYLHEITRVCTESRDLLRGALEEGAFPLVLGGDHSLTMGTGAAVADHYRSRGEKVGLLWVDAHTDMNSPEITPSGNIHGMSLSVLTGVGAPSLLGLASQVPAVDPRHVAVLGAREIDPREQEAVRASLDWLCAQGWQRVCAVGTSMGGVAVLLAVTAPSFQGTPADRALAGVVTIGAFTRLTDVLDVVARRNGLPRQAATPLARAAGRIAGYDPADAAPIDHVHRLRAPYLAVQGAQDELVPTHHAGQLATAAPQVGAQAAHYAGGHDEPSNPDLQRIVLGFLDRRAAR